MLQVLAILCQLKTHSHVVCSEDKHLGKRLQVSKACLVLSHCVMRKQERAGVLIVELQRQRLDRNVEDYPPLFKFSLK
ncbi:hypothetical protein OS493_040264 [Desmophyllum pertusum]|uniref:Uncharacterized protein n=1 Tax=Desmophyllum pertusum TaxID=174260 RepID=A0A9W9YIH9_9CNID|nr:hypothetical protein OS493_040264 [Desmophyllum pertusum]